MATMKAYTTIEQSRKLADILPLESADMWYQHTGISIKDGSEKPIYFPMVIRDCESNEDIPCWSLAALLDVLESEINNEDGETCQLNIVKGGTWWYIEYIDQYGEANPIETKSTEELIDACYEMILKLNELKML